MPLDQDPKGVLAGRVAVGLEVIQELAIGHGSECPHGPQRIQRPRGNCLRTYHHAGSPRFLVTGFGLPPPIIQCRRHRNPHTIS